MELAKQIIDMGFVMMKLLVCVLILTLEIKIAIWYIKMRRQQKVRNG